MNFKPLFYFHIARTKAGTLECRDQDTAHSRTSEKEREKNNKTFLTDIEKHISQNMIRKMRKTRAKQRFLDCPLNLIKFL